MSRTHASVAVALALLVGGGIWLLGRGDAGTSPGMEGAGAGDVSSMASSPVVELDAESVERGQIEVRPAEKRAIDRTLTITGRVQLDEDRTARVGSPAEGRVTRVLVGLGEAVEAGTPLLTVHSHELLQARADEAKARSAIAAAERKRARAETELARADRLLEAKAISERAQLEAATELAAAEAELEQAHADKTRAEHYLAHLGVGPDDSGEEGDLIVRTPIAGVVLERSVTVGTVVHPADDLVLVSDVHSLWVVGEVPEREAALVAAGQGVELEVEAFPEERFEAVVFHVGERLDPRLRTVPLRAEVENPDARLRPEMYATLHVRLATAEPVLAVPDGAIQRFEGADVVFVEVGPRQYERRQVVLEPSVDGWTPIAGGLSAGERVVVRGSFLVKSELLRSRFEEE